MATTTILGPVDGATGMFRALRGQADYFRAALDPSGGGSPSQRLQALSNANKDAAKALTESKSGVEALEKRADEEGYGILAPVKKAIDEYQALAAKISKVHSCPRQL